MKSFPKPAKVYKDPRRRSPVNAEGRIGRMQRAWNARIMAGWRFAASARGEVLRSAISGLSAGLVVGHIESRVLDPGKRTDPRNVAPITWEENELMARDPHYRVDAQRLMRLWLEKQGRTR